MTSLRSMSTRVAYEKYATPFQIKPALLMGRGSGGLKYHCGEGALLLRTRCKATWGGKGKVLRKLTLARVLSLPFIGDSFRLWRTLRLLTFSCSRACKSVYLEKFFSAFFFPGVSCGIVVLVQRLFLCPGLDLFFSCASFPNLEYTW